MEEIISKSPRTCALDVNYLMMMDQKVVIFETKRGSLAKDTKDSINALAVMLETSKKLKQHMGSTG